MASLFGQMAYEAVGEIARKHQKEAYEKLTKAALAGLSGDQEEEARLTKEANDILGEWGQGGTNKIALHALVGGIMSNLSGNSFGTGAVAGGLNEALQKGLGKWEEDHPAANQWASLVIGAAVGGVTGGASALSGTKYNWDNTGHNFILDSLNYPQQDVEEMRKINRKYDLKTQGDDIGHAMGLEKTEQEYIDEEVQKYRSGVITGVLSPYPSEKDAIKAASEKYAIDNAQRRVDIRNRCAEELNTAIKCKSNGDREGALYHLTVALHVVADDRAHRQADAGWFEHGPRDIITLPNTTTSTTPSVDNKDNNNNLDRFKDSVRAANEINNLYQIGGIVAEETLDSLFPPKKF